MSRLSALKGLTQTDLFTLYRNAAQWPLSGKALAGCAVACLVAVLGNALFLGDARERLQQEQAREVALLEQISAKGVQAAVLESARRGLEASRLAFSRLLRQFPVESEVPGLLDDIARLGSTHGLTVDSIQLLDEQPKGSYVELPLHLALTGSYHDLAAFIHGLSGLSQIVTVHDLKFTAIDLQLNLELQARTYRYNLQGDEGLRALASDSNQSAVRAAYDAASLRDPFQPPLHRLGRTPGRLADAPDPARVRGPLEGIALEQFQMVGTLSRGTEVFALLRAASAIHRLAVGDYLGPDNGRILVIEAGHIEVAELFPDGEGAWLERTRTLVLNVNS
ncbi:MAG: hypothetical protein GAK37_02973 [Pseudomonas sp.]|nr:MAG: hypothetical protein GAK37_02973 [Pseudomonas sp.]